MKNIVIALLASVFLGSATAAEMSFHLSFTKDDVALTSSRGYASVRLKDGVRLDATPGAPDLPARIVKVRLPDGCDACSVSATSKSVLLADDVRVMPVQRPVLSGSAAAFVQPDTDAYAAAKSVEVAKLLAVRQPRGYLVAEIAVRPLRYDDSAKTLELVTDLDLTVVANPPRRAFAAAPGTQENAVSRKSDRRRTFEAAINREVLNPYTAEESAQGTSARSLAAAAPTFEYLIIAPQQFVSALQPLAAFRQTFNGVNATILTLEEIEAGYSGTCPDGTTDTPMKMRNAIMDYVVNHGTEYVFLVGDVSVLPTRRVLITADAAVSENGYHYYDCPADVYFRCLHGDWDTNRNGVWGDSGDDFDFSLDVYLGRLPVVSAAQVAAYVNKVIAYENDRGGGAAFVKKTLMVASACWRTVTRTKELNQGFMGEEWWSDSYSGFFPRTKMNDGLTEFTDFSDNDLASDEMIWSRYMFRDVINVGYGKGQQLYGFFDYLTSWDTGAKGSYDLTGSNLETRLNDGYHNVYIGTHGNFPVWCLEHYEDSSYAPGYFITNQASRVTGRINHIYTTACLTAGWDDHVEVGASGTVYNFEPCLAEAWLRNPNTCVTYIGNAREGWGYPLDTNGGYDEGYARAYFDQISLKGARTIGEAHAKSVDLFGSIAKYATIFRWTNCSNQMLGDPMTTVITPQSFVAPDVGVPTAQIAGGALSMSVPVTDLGGEGVRADVIFEVSVDDEHFTRPILVPVDFRLTEATTATAVCTKIPASAQIVFVRARVVPTVGNSTVSEPTAVRCGSGTPTVAEALDTPGRSWQTPSSGSYQWSVLSDGTASAGYCVHASKGKIGERELQLKTSVTGPAKLTFYTQKPTEGGLWEVKGYFDNVDVIDNIFLETRPIEERHSEPTYGNALWVKRATFVPAGSHTAVFSYRNWGGMNASDKDDFFVDRVLIRANEDGIDLSLDPTGTASENRADLLLTVEDFSTMTQSATVKLEYSRFADFSYPMTNGTVTTVSGTGTKTLTLNNLSPNTDYYVRALVTGPTKTLPLGMARVKTASRANVTTPTIHSLTVTQLTSNSATIEFDLSVGSTGSADIFAIIVGNSYWRQTLTESKVYTLDFDKLKPSTTYTLSVTFGGASQDLTFTTLAQTTPTYTAPEVGTVSVSAVDITTASVAVQVKSLGNAVSSATVTVFVYENGGTSPVFTGSKSVTSSGTSTFAVTGLTGGKDYVVRTRVTNNQGLEASGTDKTFTTLAPAQPEITLTEASAAVNEEGTQATLEVSVASCNLEDAVLTLTLNGTEAKVWQAIAAGDYSFTAEVTPGSTNTFVFTATGGGLTRTATGSFVAKAYLAWFDVSFGDDGFAEGEGWMAASTDPSGGTFTASDEQPSVLVKGDENHIKVGGEVAYTPSHPSGSNADVKITGRVQVSSVTELPPVPEGAKGAICFIRGRPNVYAAQGWTTLSASFAAGKWIDYAMAFDYSSESAPRIRYTVGSVSSDWLALDGTACDVRKMLFRNGSVGNFKAVCTAVGGGEVIELVRPEFVTGGTALGVSGLAGAAGATFSMTIANPVAGAYYTVFTSETLDGTFRAESDSIRFDAGTTTYTLTVKADTPSKFARVVISDQAFAQGAELQ